MTEHSTMAELELLDLAYRSGWMTKAGHEESLFLTFLAVAYTRFGPFPESFSRQLVQRYQAGYDECPPDWVEVKQESVPLETERGIAWYQERFSQLKLQLQTRRHLADNEVLVFSLESGPCRVTYLSVDQAGVTVCAEPDVRLYADWHKGDRFERMYKALGWMVLPGGVSLPVMRWDEYRVWEVTPPLQDG